MNKPNQYHPSICHISYVDVQLIENDCFLPNGERFIQLVPGHTWQHIPSEGDIVHTIDQKDQTSKLTFKVVGSSTLLEQDLIEMNTKRYVICFKDHSGRWKVFGRKDQGVKIKRIFENKRTSILSTFEVEIPGQFTHLVNGPVLPRLCAYQFDVPNLILPKNELVLTFDDIDYEEEGLGIFEFKIFYGYENTLISFQADLVENSRPSFPSLMTQLLSSFNDFDGQFSFSIISSNIIKFTFDGETLPPLIFAFTYGAALKNSFVSFHPALTIVEESNYPPSGNAGNCNANIIALDHSVTFEIFKNQQWVAYPSSGSETVKIIDSIDTITKWRVKNNDIILDEGDVIAKCKIR